MPNDPTLIDSERRRGRGARSNRAGRYESELRETFDDGWESLGELEPFRTEVARETAKSIIATNDSPDIGFDQSINPYRGCEHGCIYCYARPTHAYLGLSPGLDFETRLTAKVNAAELLERRETPKKTSASSSFGIKVQGVEDVMLRLAKCCRPMPGDPIVGYISLGKGITIHHETCPNAQALMRNPERFTKVAWEGDTSAPFRVELQVDGWDRHRLLEDLSRTFAETGINILEARCTVVHPMVKNRFVVEVGDTASLKTCITRLRNIDSVFDAYRVTPTG